MLAFTLQQRKTLGNSVMRPYDEGCATSRHLRWDPLPLNEVDRIVQHDWTVEGRKEGKEGVL